jgi:hypothetical protein
MMRVMLTLGFGACFIDAYTTWVALTHNGFQEATPAVAHLIATTGLIPGLFIAGVLRCAAFVLVALVARCVRWTAVPLVVVGLLGAAFTWYVALSNIVTLAQG